MYTVLLLVVFILLRVSFVLSRRIIERVLLSIIVLSCVIEVLTGYYQLIFDSSYQSALLSVKGHFNNSGIYGGYLTVCFCILLAYYNITEPVYVKRFLGWVLILIVIQLPVLQSRASLLALLVSLFFLRLKENKQKKVKKRTLIIVSILAVMCFTGLYFLKKPSADGRFFIYKTCLQIIKKNGIHGVGTNFAGEYGLAQATYFIKQVQCDRMDKNPIQNIDEKEKKIVDCPQYAFNDSLQIGVEYGWPMMLLFMLVNIFTIKLLYRNNSIWTYGLIAFCIFGLFSYPLKVMPFQLLYVVLLASCTYGKYNTVLFVLFISLMLIVRALQPNKTDYLNEFFKECRYNKEWKHIQNNHKMGYYSLVVPMCDSIYEKMRNNHAFLFVFGQSLNKIEEYEKSDSVLQLGTQISSDPMFWNVMGNNSLAQGKYREAEERYKHAFYMVPNRLYPLYLLAKLYHTEGDTVKFLDMADKVETFIPKVESVNTERLRNEIRDLKSGYITEQYE